MARLSEDAAERDLLHLGALYLRRRGVPSDWLGLAYRTLYPISQLIVFNWRTDYETPVILWGLKQAQLNSHTGPPTNHLSRIWLP